MTTWFSRASPLILPSAPASRAFEVSDSRWHGCWACSRRARHAKRSSTNYPYLETEDIDAALRYAAFLAEDETLELTR